MSSKHSVRPSLWVHPETVDVPEPSRLRLTDPKKVEKLIISNLKSSWIYRKTEKIKHDDPALETGMLHRNFRLSDCRIWIGYLEKETVADNIILKVLGDLVKSGRLKIFSLGQDRFMDRYDMKFCSEIGTAIRSFSGQIGPKYKAMRFYPDKPLAKAEFDQYCLLDISGRVQKIRQKQDEYLQKRHGRSGLEMEAKLHRENIMEELDLKRRLIAEVNKKSL